MILLIYSIVISLTFYIILNNKTKKFIWDEMIPPGRQEKPFVRFAMTKLYQRDCVVGFIVLMPVLIYFNIF